MVDISWPSPLNVGSLFSVPDKTTFFLAALYFCSPQSRTLLKCPSPLTPPPPPPHQWWCSVFLLRNQGSAAVLITKVGRGGAFEVFCSLFFILLLTQGQLISNARVVSSLVLWSVTIRALNSVASHLFMICKNWHVPKSLYVIRLVYRPQIGRGVPGRNFIDESQIKQHPVPLKLHHASPSELVWVFWLAYDWVGNSCSYSSNMLAIVCVDRTSTLSRPPKTSTSAQPSVL